MGERIDYTQAAPRGVKALGGVHLYLTQSGLPPVSGEAGHLFDARERAALAWADVVTRIADTGAADSAYAQLSERFADKELAELTIAIGLMNAYNRLAISFRNPPSAVAANTG